MKSQFLNTPWGSWCKVALSAALGQYLVIITDPEQALLSWQSLQNLGVVASTAVVPVIINYLNPSDPRYGRKP